MKKVVLFILILSCISTSLLASPPEESEILELLNFYRTEEVREKLIKFLDLHGREGARVHDWIARSYIQDREIEEALSFARKSVALDSEYVEGYATLVQIYYLNKKWTEGLTAAENALEINPKNLRANYYHGLLLLDNGLSDEAIEAFEAVKKLDPEFKDVESSLALAYRDEGYHDLENESYKKMIASDPEGASLAYRNLGIDKLEQSHYKEAIEYLEKAVRSDPHDAEAYFYLGEAYEFENRVEEAVKVFEKAMKLRPEWIDVYRALGPLAGEVNNFKLSAFVFEHLIEREPELVNHYVHLGFAYQRQGQADKAIEIYQKVLEMDAELATVAFNLGVIYREKGMHSTAIESFKRAVEIDPAAPEFYYELSIVYCETGRVRAAHDAYAKSESLGGYNLKELKGFLDYKCPLNQ